MAARFGLRLVIPFEYIDFDGLRYTPGVQTRW
jgi:hypothetical protein